MDSLGTYYRLHDTLKYQEIHKHHEGVLLNLGTLYIAAGQDEQALEMYARVVPDESDLPKAYGLLGFSNDDEIDSSLKPQEISVAKVKYMLSEAPKKKKKDSEKEKAKPNDSKEKPPKGKKTSKNLVRKGVVKLDRPFFDVLYVIDLY